MQYSNTDRGTTSLVRELLRNHRNLLRILGLLLAVAGTTVGYALFVAQPRLERYIDLSYYARNGQIATLEQSAAMRGWLATGEDRFLDEYRRATSAAERALTRVVGEVSGDGTAGLTDAVVRSAVARTAWTDWADAIIRSPLGATVRDQDTTLARDEIRAALAEGTALFTTYLDANADSTGLILQQRHEALVHERRALLTGLAFFVVTLAAAMVTATRRRRAIDREVVEPINRLLGTIEQLQDGELGARTASTGVRELDQVGAALAALASSLDEARTQADAREARLALLASRFETVVRVGREIAGSLSVRYVARSVTSAAADLLAAPATLWVRGEDQAFHAVSRSIDPHGTVPPVDLRPSDAVAGAAADARPVSDGDHCAYPLVLAGMVVGVLETEGGAVDEDTEQVLQALLSTAAASLESANLHSAARELADVDALTRLPNRRRFEGDIEAEWERCRRYGRPLSLVMVDLDHFKTLNDEHGHLFGDEVLRGASTALTGALRTSDTAYRYGGEEFVILLRETGLEDALDVAERLRTAIAEFTVPGQGVLVTASAGVAERVSTMAHHTELVAKADAALYDAKHRGRDRVVAADAAR